MAKKTHFRTGMIADAQKASTAMQSSTIATPLQQNGFTAATMAQAASEMTDLHAKAEAAHNAWLQASAALSTRAQAFDQTWSAYCNIVRGLTKDATTRKTHGVSSPGIKKCPAFKRAPRATATATATAPAAPTAATPATPPKA
ncbi:MAG: hypothetical protein ACRELB_11230 [Polyangiaceae bacterium]